MEQVLALNSGQEPDSVRATLYKVKISWILSTLQQRVRSSQLPPRAGDALDDGMMGVKYVSLRSYRPWMMATIDSFLSFYFSRPPKQLGFWQHNMRNYMSG